VELRPLSLALIAFPRGPACLATAGVLAVLLVCGALAPTVVDAAPKLREPSSEVKPPRGFDRTSREVKRIAARAEKVRAEAAGHHGYQPTAYTRGPGTWQVSYFDGDSEVVQVRIDDATGAILEQWSGHHVAWTMARGYEGAFGRKFNSPWLLIPLGLLFLAPFVDPRRPLRIVHLDLLMLLGFGVGHVFFNRGEIGLSTPLAYPVLVYLLGRLLWLGARPRAGPQRLLPLVPVGWLIVALGFLAAFRVGLNLIDSNVIDVGYASVIGADRIGAGEGLYGAGFSPDVERGDTYGPFTYLSYIPFEQVLPWDGGWDGLHAAHAAAITFDLLTLAGLVLLGRRLRPGVAGTELGVALGYAWATYPYALFALTSNANDALVALLCVVALLALTLVPARPGASAAARAVALGLGAAAKFAPLALAPLFATGKGGDGRRRQAAVFVAVLAAMLAAAFLPFIPDGGVRELYDRSVGYQAARRSPFSIWGLVESLRPLQSAVKAAAAVLALAVAFVPRRRDAFQVAALGAAVLVAVQLTTTYWFYLYVVWFAPFALIGMLGPLRGSAGPEPSRADVDEHAGSRAARESVIVA